MRRRCRHCLQPDLRYDIELNDVATLLGSSTSLPHGATSAQLLVVPQLDASLRLPLADNVEPKLLGSSRQGASTFADAVDQAAALCAAARLVGLSMSSCRGLQCADRSALIQRASSRALPTPPSCAPRSTVGCVSS